MSTIHVRECSIVWLVSIEEGKGGGSKATGFTFPLTRTNGMLSLIKGLSVRHGMQCDMQDDVAALTLPDTAADNERE